MIQQFRKLVRFHDADLMFTDAAIKEIARIALERGTGARGLRGGGRGGLGGGLVRCRGGGQILIMRDGQERAGGEAEPSWDTEGATLESPSGPAVSERDAWLAG